MILRHLKLAVVWLITLTAIPAVGQNNALPVETASASPLAVPPSSKTVPWLEHRNARYRLRKGDSFDLDFAYSPEFNQTVSVQPDGYVSLKEIGPFRVEGQTVPELTENLKVAYAKMLHNPVIAVLLKDFEKPYFIVGGQVSKPGKYDLRSDMTVTEAVAIAGWFTEKAKHSQVVLFHPLETGGYEAKLLNIKQLLASRNLAEDPQLQPGDMLYVPQNNLSKIKPFMPVPSFGAAALF